MTNLEAKDISKSFFIKHDELKILKNINLSINQGELIAITGASGSGKSTLLHILASLDSPTTGNVYFKNKQINNMSKSVLSKIRLSNFGFVYQFHHLLADLTVLENIILPGKILGTKKEVLLEYAYFIINFLGLENRASHLPWKLSGGERQRVAVARSLINKPNIIFLDEPTGNLDIKNSKILQELILKIAKDENISIIAATHDQDFMTKFKKLYKIENSSLYEVENV